MPLAPLGRQHSEPFDAHSDERKLRNDGSDRITHGSAETLAAERAKQVKRRTTAYEQLQASGGSSKEGAEQKGEGGTFDIIHG